MNETDDRATLWGLIKDIRFAMFTTRDGDGNLHSRPLTTQNQDGDQDDMLWFFVPRDSEVFAELQGDAQASVVYASPDKDAYVAVSGSAESVDDPQQKHRLWSKMNEAWFPNGPDDPGVMLLRVRIRRAEYWDVKASKLVQLVHMAKSAVTRKPPKDLGDHKQVHLH